LYKAPVAGGGKEGLLPLRQQDARQGGGSRLLGLWDFLQRTERRRNRFSPLTDGGLGEEGRLLVLCCPAR